MATHNVSGNAPAMIRPQGGIAVVLVRVSLAIRRSFAKRGVFAEVTSELESGTLPHYLLSRTRAVAMLRDAERQLLAKALPATTLRSYEAFARRLLSQLGLPQAALTALDPQTMDPQSVTLAGPVATLDDVRKLRRIADPSPSGRGWGGQAYGAQLALDRLPGTHEQYRDVVLRRLYDAWFAASEGTLGKGQETQPLAHRLEDHDGELRDAFKHLDDLLRRAPVTALPGQVVTLKKRLAAMNDCTLQATLIRALAGANRITVVRSPYE